MRSMQDQPIRLGILSGMLICGWVGFLAHSLIVGVVVGLIVGGFQAVVWRRGGPAHGWRAWLLDRFPGGFILRRRRRWAWSGRRLANVTALTDAVSRG